MAMIYHNPNTVLHPRKFIKNIEVLYDGTETGFSLAIVDWEGIDHIGIRWNVAIKELENADKHSGQIICHGSPATNGVPSWFILPRELFNPTLFDATSADFLQLVADFKK